MVGKKTPGEGPMGLPLTGEAVVDFPGYPWRACRPVQTGCARSLKWADRPLDFQKGVCTDLSYRQVKGYT